VKEAIFGRSPERVSALLVVCAMHSEQVHLHDNKRKRASDLFVRRNQRSLILHRDARADTETGWLCFARCWLADGWRFMARRKGKRAETFFAPLPGRAADTLPLWTLAFSSSF
jgi:hypothetical protein